MKDTLCMDDDVLIINCELTEYAREYALSRQSFAGIRIAQQLRVDGYRKPIIFTSFLSRKQLTDGHLDRAIVNAVGHSFLRLPYSEEELEAEVKRVQEQLSSDDGRPVRGELSDLELYDIQNNYCLKHGMAQLKIHALEGLATRGDLSIQKVIEECEECLNQVCSLFGVISEDAVKEFNSQLDTADENDKGKLVRWVSSYCLDLVESNTGASSVSKLKAKYPWKLLLVDDEIEEEHQLVSELRSRGIEVILSHSAEKAEAILQDDNPIHPRIMVVLSDYRLEEEKDGVKIHQRIQGYQFLQHVTASGRIVKIAALSAMPRKFLLESFKHYGIRAQVYSKKDFALDQESSINFLADEMINLGNENWAVVQSLPDTKGWRDMEQAYSRYNTHPNYANMERKVSFLVKANIESFEKSGALIDEFLTPSNPYSAKKSGGVIDVDKDVLQFMEYMKSRRIAIWLGAVRKPPLDLTAMVSLMANREKSENMRKLILNKLGVVVTDYPLGLTVEEQRWLQYDMGIKLLSSVEFGQEIMERLRSEVQKIFQDNGFLRDYLSDSDFIPCEYNNEEIDVFFLPSDYYPMFRSANALKALIERINTDLTPETPDYKYKLSVLLGLRKMLRERIKSAVDLPSFQSLNSFLINLSAPFESTIQRKGKVVDVVEKRHREYQRLYEPWTLLSFGDMTKDQVEQQIVGLIEDVRSGVIVDDRSKKILFDLSVLIQERRGSIPDPERTDLYNEFIYEVLDSYKYQVSTELNKAIKEGVRDIDNFSNWPISSEQQELEPVIGFNPTIGFLDDESNDDWFFDDNTKDSIVASFMKAMRGLNAKADSEQDQIMFFSPEYFIEYSKMHHFKEKSPNWKSTVAIVAGKGQRLIYELEIAERKTNWLKSILPGIWMVLAPNGETTNVN